MAGRAVGRSGSAIDRRSFLRLLGGAAGLSLGGRALGGTTAAVEAAPYGVRINAVAPSLALHPFLNRVFPDEELDRLRRAELFGRSAETWEVANVMVFLASDYSSYMSGEVISVSSQHP